MAEFELKLSDNNTKEAILFLLVQLNANTIALHDHLLKFQAKDNEHYEKLCKEAFKLREAHLNQMLSNLYGKYGNVDFDGLLSENPKK